MNRKTACGGFENTFLTLNLSSFSQKEKLKKIPKKKKNICHNIYTIFEDLAIS
jgi:hypothetical protein